jgi:hypothetical protein
MKLKAAFQGLKPAAKYRAKFIRFHRLAGGKVEHDAATIFTPSARTACHLNILVGAKWTEAIAFTRRFFHIQKYNRPCGHIQTDCECFRTKQDLNKTARKEQLDDFF